MNPQLLSLHIQGDEIISDQEFTYEIAKMQLKTKETLETRFIFGFQGFFCF